MELFEEILERSISTRTKLSHFLPERNVAKRRDRTEQVEKGKLN